MKKIEKNINSNYEMEKFGAEIANFLRGGEVIELIGDVGAGKTTLTKGLAKALGINEEVQSPSFTISRFYDNDKLSLTHYDFYRLDNPGIMKNELMETLGDLNNVTVIEWAENIADILPMEHIRINISIINETSRLVSVEGLK